MKLRRTRDDGVVIFDVDGTLITDELYLRAHNFVLRDILQRPDVALTGLEWTQIAGVSNKEAFQAVAAKAAALGKELGIEEGDYRAEAKRYFYDHISEVELRLGALDILGTVENLGFTKGISTNAGRVETDAKLEVVELQDRFRFTSTLDGEVRGKPFPDIYLNALAKAGDCLGRKIEPSAAIAVEDTLIGVKAALAAGCQTIWWQHGYEKDGQDIRNERLFTEKDSQGVIATISLLTAAPLSPRGFMPEPALAALRR
jgi:HAD superfamily hydrolase (TIGR01509 family)